MRSVIREGLWCFVVISSVLAVACTDDGEPGSGGYAGENASGEAGTGGGGKGNAGAGAAATGGTAAGASPRGGSAGSTNQGGAAAGEGSLPVGGTAGAAGGTGAGGSDDDAGGATGAGGEPGETKAGFAYVSTILGGLVALSRDGKSGALDALEGSPVGKGHLTNVLVDHRRKFLYTLDVDTDLLSVYPLAADGQLDEPSSTTAVAGQPFTAALDPSDHFLYVTSQEDGVLSTFTVGAADGKLTQLGEPLDLEGSPAFVAVSPNGKYLYVSLQFPGSIRGFALDAQDGSLDELDDSPFAAGEVFGGALAFTPDSAFLYSTGSGLHGFAVGEDGALEPLTEEPFTEDVGSDFYATNLAVDPQGKYLYVTEFLQTRHVSGFAIDADSGLLSLVGAPLTSGSPYSVAVDPSGRFVYAPNDDGTVSGYRVKRADGTLKELEGSPFQFGGLQPEMVFWVP